MTIWRDDPVFSQIRDTLKALTERLEAESLANRELMDRMVKMEAFIEALQKKKPQWVPAPRYR